jgi:hypothetical protein
MPSTITSLGQTVLNGRVMDNPWTPMASASASLPFIRASDKMYVS